MGFRGKIGIEVEFYDPQSWVLFGIRFENRIAIVVRIEARSGSLTLQGSFLLSSHFPAGLKVQDKHGWYSPRVAVLDTVNM